MNNSRHGTANTSARSTELSTTARTPSGTDGEQITLIGTFGVQFSDRAWLAGYRRRITIQMSKREPEFEESHDGTERANKVVEEQGGLPENNPFTEVVEDLRDDGDSWNEIYDKLNAVFDVCDAAAFEEELQLIPEWRVAAIKSDPNATSGERYEYHTRTAETAEEAEEMVERNTACRVEQSKTEQVGVGKVS